MTFQKMEKGSFFCDKTSQPNVNNFFLLEVVSSMVAQLSNYNRTNDLAGWPACCVCVAIDF